MRITYVGFGDFHRYAGMKQLYHFAQEVCRRGHAAQILIAGPASSVAVMDEPPASEVIELSFRGPWLSPSVRRRVSSFRPDIIHEWTPRHVPALTGWQLQRLTGAALILDHEDDEDYLRRGYLGSQGTGYRGFGRPAVRAIARLKGQFVPWLSPLCRDGSPRRMAKDNLAVALIQRRIRAHTAISPGLVEQVRRTWPSAPVHLLYPGADLSRFGCDAGDMAVARARLGVPSGRLLAYTGTLNLAIFRYLVDVLELVRQQEQDVNLVLVGNDEFRVEAEQVLQQRGLHQVVRLTGIVPYTQIPELLAAADVLLQHPYDIGNELRLPAKLPEYLAARKPLVTYSQGIGAVLQDGVHALKLKSTDPSEMAAKIVFYLTHPIEAAEMARNARLLAEELFDWKVNGSRLVRVYEEVLDRAKNVAPHG